MFFGAKTPNMDIWPQTSKFLESFETYNSFLIDLPVRFQRALNDFSIYLQTRFMPIFVFWGQKPQIWKYRPRPPKNIFFGLDDFISLTCFQQALNHYLAIILSQYMTSSIICQTGQTGLLDFSRLGDKSGRI